MIINDVEHDKCDLAVDVCHMSSITSMRAFEVNVMVEKNNEKYLNDQNEMISNKIQQSDQTPKSAEQNKK